MSSNRHPLPLSSAIIDTFDRFFLDKAKHRQQPAQALPKDNAIPKPTVVGSQKRKAPKQTIRRTADISQSEISRELIGLDTLATLALVQANGTPQ